MSEETKTVSSSQTPEADSSASEARSAAPPAIAKVRTRLQDVRLEISQESVRLSHAITKYEHARSAQKAALAARNRDPNNEVLSEELAHATELLKSWDSLSDISAEHLERLRTELQQLRLAETAYFKQKGQQGKHLLC